MTSLAQAIYKGQDQARLCVTFSITTITDGQMDRQTDKTSRETDRQTNRKVDRSKDRQVDRQTYRQTDGYTDRHTDRHRERDRLCIPCLWILQGNPYQTGRVSTANLLALTSSDQLVLILRIYFYIFPKQAIFMSRKTVKSLPPQQGFLDSSHQPLLVLDF